MVCQESIYRQNREGRSETTESGAKRRREQRIRNKKVAEGGRTW